MSKPLRLEIRQRLERVDVPFGHDGLDPYGISRRTLGRLLALLGFLYRHYHRVQVSGMDYVPSSGRAMLVANHSGGYALDAGMLIAACFFEMDPPRLAHGMADKFLGRLPFASTIAVRSGQLPGLPEHAARLLQKGRLLMVFPEGVRGTAKLFHRRYDLVEFGTGFARLALQTDTPVIPVGIAGAGEAIPTVANLRRLGGWLGVPYVPVTPYLLPLPLPKRLCIAIGPRLKLSGSGTERDVIVLEQVERVKRRIAVLVDRARSIREAS